MQPSRPLSRLIRSAWTERLVMFVLVPALLLYSAWLPPLNLGGRLFFVGYAAVAPEGGTVSGPTGASLLVPGGALSARTRIRLDVLDPAGTGIAGAEFVGAVAAGDLMGLREDSPPVVAARSVPEHVAIGGPIYEIHARGPVPSRATLSLPMPAEIAAPEATDVYCWDGVAWRWAPSAPSEDGGAIEAQLDALPEFVMVGQSVPAAPAVAVQSATAAHAGEFGANRAYVGNATVEATGQIVGAEPHAAAIPAFLTVSSPSRGDGVGGAVEDVLRSPEATSAHLQAVLDAVHGGGHAGAELDYVVLDPSLRDALASFVGDLAAALHAEGLGLAVRLDEGRTEGAYDWRALGAAADIVRLPAMADPAAYAPGGDMDRLLLWATGQVERSKLELVISAAARDVVDGVATPIPHREALGALADGLAIEGAGAYLPGEVITVTLRDPDYGADSWHYHEAAQAYTFTYTDEGERPHTVWLESGSSVARKLQYVRNYGLGHVSFADWDPESSDRGILDALETFQENAAPLPPQFALVWTMADEAGNVLQQRVAPADNARSSWTAPDSPGHYVIRAALSDDAGRTSLGEPAAVPFVVPTATLTPSPTPTPAPTETPTPLPTDTPAPTDTPDPNAPPPTAVPTDEPPAPPPPPPPSGGGSFGYGVQADMITDGDHDRIFGHIQGMGFGWVKQQVEWFRYNPDPGVYDWGALDRIVDGANARGIHVLFSVVKAPNWARPDGDDRSVAGPPADPNTYGTFIREMAARYKGRVRAYEIWNEQNLWYEWGGRGHRLNAAAYVNLLRVAYSNIKAVDPGAIVVAGALTPTGFSDGDTAIDDRIYLEQMYQAGLKNYCDAVGAHPSGYNNPPDADWRNWSDPSAPSFKGHPSFFFRGTMESYRNIMVKYGDGGKRVWVTEFGWATVENLGAGPAPGYEYAAHNSEAEQAQFLARAYQMGRSWGWVGPMFLWNLNFAPVSGIHDEKAAFGIVRGDWGQRPAYAALRDMPK